MDNQFYLLLGTIAHSVNGIPIYIKYLIAFYIDFRLETYVTIYRSCFQ